MMQLYNIIIISNISVEVFFVPKLRECFQTTDKSVQITAIQYQEYRNQDYLKNLREAHIVIVWLNLEALLPEIHNGDEECWHRESREQNVKNLIHGMKEYISLQSGAFVFWLSFEDYFLNSTYVLGHCTNVFTDEMNRYFEKDISEQEVVIDFKRLIAKQGIDTAYSVKYKFRWNYPYSKQLTDVIAKEIRKQYFANCGITKKCLVLDCDNVLWGGILSEDGIENIRLGSSGFGREFQEFQRFVLSLYYRGVILAISSKNDLKDVLSVFRENDEMILKKEHIACFQVNWENKPSNILKIAETLNIGLESIVFVDDSISEIEIVNAMLPQVETILYNRESMYSRFDCFNLKLHMSADDIAKRNETYRTNGFRKSLKAQYDNYDDYLAALNIKMEIHKALPVEYARIAELTQRTNRCSNGTRYTTAQIIGRTKNETVNLYSVFLADCYSDLGLVGVMEVEGDVLTLFSLSCRALGRDVENKMLEFLMENYEINKVVFLPTGKNESLNGIFMKAFPDSSFKEEG